MRQSTHLNTIGVYFEYVRANPDYILLVYLRIVLSHKTYVIVLTRNTKLESETSL